MSAPPAADHGPDPAPPGDPAPSASPVGAGLRAGARTPRPGTPDGQSGEAGTHAARLWRELRPGADGLVPAVIAEVSDGRVLTLCRLDEAALGATLATGRVHVFRRSRGRVMMKGEQSGHVQRLARVSVDCEGRGLLLWVHQHVGACHRGYRSCFFRDFDLDTGELRATEAPVFDPRAAYPPAGGGEDAGENNRR